MSLPTTDYTEHCTFTSMVMLVTTFFVCYTLIIIDTALIKTRYTFFYLG